MEAMDCRQLLLVALLCASIKLSCAATVEDLDNLDAEFEGYLTESNDADGYGCRRWTQSGKLCGLITRVRCPRFNNKCLVLKWCCWNCGNYARLSSSTVLRSTPAVFSTAGPLRSSVAVGSSILATPVFSIAPSSSKAIRSVASIPFASFAILPTSTQAFAPPQSCTLPQTERPTESRKSGNYPRPSSSRGLRSTPAILSNAGQLRSSVAVGSSIFATPSFSIAPSSSKAIRSVSSIPFASFVILPTSTQAIAPPQSSTLPTTGTPTKPTESVCPSWPLWLYQRICHKFKTTKCYTAKCRFYKRCCWLYGNYARPSSSTVLRSTPAVLSTAGQLRSSVAVGSSIFATPGFSIAPSSSQAIRSVASIPFASFAILPTSTRAIAPPQSSTLPQTERPTETRKSGRLRSSIAVGSSILATPGFSIEPSSSKAKRSVSSIPFASFAILPTSTRAITLPQSSTFPPTGRPSKPRKLVCPSWSSRFYQYSCYQLRKAKCSTEKCRFYERCCLLYGDTV